MNIQVDEEKTCKDDSRIRVITPKDMYGMEMMFCYEIAGYISVNSCTSRNPNATCNKFQSIKDFKEKQGIAKDE